MLSFSTSPKTHVSTFLFSTGAHRPFQQHTEEGLHIDSRQAARLSRYLWVSLGFFRPWNPQVTPGALIFLGYQLHMLWIWVFRPFSVASMPNPPWPGRNTQHSTHWDQKHLTLKKSLLQKSHLTKCSRGGYPQHYQRIPYCCYCSVTKLGPTLCDSMDCSPAGSSVLH